MTFDEFAEDNGLMLTHLIADGRWHRCRTQSHPKKKNGAYKFDGVQGWVRDWALHERPVLYRIDTQRMSDAERREAEMLAAVRRRTAIELRASEARRAAAEARRQIEAAKTDHHPYLARKGFPQAAGLVLDGVLLVPQWRYDDYGQTLTGVQRITADGEKKFLPGFAAELASFVLGRGDTEILCEGYATGLSIIECARRMQLQVRVVVCFSAWGLTQIALQRFGGRRRLVVADNDKSGAGERAARETELPYVMPPTVGHDFNDYHQTAGMFRACALLGTAL